MTVLINYYCKQTTLGSLPAEKTGKAVLFYVFNMVFPASPFGSKIWVFLFKNKPAVQAAGAALPNATPPIGKIYPFSKIAVTFERVMQFLDILG